MRILAIDPSLTCWGVAVGTPHETTVGRWGPPHTGMRRLDAASEKIYSLHGWHLPDLVVLEGYSFASKGRAVVSIGELGGVIRLALHHIGVAWVEVPPSNLKKWATGKGNAGKEEVLAAAIRRLDYQGHSHDEADALWLLHMAGHHYRQPWAADVPKAHQVGKAPAWPSIHTPAEQRTA